MKLDSSTPGFTAALEGAGHKPGPKTTNAKAVDTPEKADGVAKEFTSFVVSQFVQEMYADMKADKLFGGGAGEETFRGLLVDEYGKLAARNGGFGLTDTVKRNILKLQEIKK